VGSAVAAVDIHMVATASMAGRISTEADSFPASDSVRDSADSVAALVEWAAVSAAAFHSQRLAAEWAGDLEWVVDPVWVLEWAAAEWAGDLEWVADLEWVVDPVRVLEWAAVVWAAVAEAAAAEFRGGSSIRCSARRPLTTLNRGWMATIRLTISMTEVSTGSRMPIPHRSSRCTRLRAGAPDHKWPLKNGSDAISR
jgi:hypothetical protein